MGRFDAVLFDFGGTLFGHPEGAELVIATAATLGVQVDRSDAEAVWHEIHQGLAERTGLWGNSDIDAAVWRARSEAIFGLADRLAPGLGAAVDASMHDPWAWVPYADTSSTLEELRAAAVPVGVVSNTGWDVSEPFRVRELEGLVATWVFSYVVGAAKPHLRPFLAACEYLGVAPERTLMVGDDPLADSGATRAGLTTLILPPVEPGAVRGLASATALATR